MPIELIHNRYENDSTLNEPFLVRSVNNQIDRINTIRNKMDALRTGSNEVSRLRELNCSYDFMIKEINQLQNEEPDEIETLELQELVIEKVEFQEDTKGLVESLLGCLQNARSDISKEFLVLEETQKKIERLEESLLNIRTDFERLSLQAGEIQANFDIQEEIEEDVQALELTLNIQQELLIQTGARAGDLQFTFDQLEQNQMIDNQQIQELEQDIQEINNSLNDIQIQIVRNEEIQQEIALINDNNRNELRNIENVAEHTNANIINLNAVQESIETGIKQRFVNRVITSIMNVKNHVADINESVIEKVQYISLSAWNAYKKGVSVINELSTKLFSHIYQKIACHPITYLAGTILAYQSLKILTDRPVVCFLSISCGWLCYVIKNYDYLKTIIPQWNNQS